MIRMEHRIVSLIPSATEIVCALGFEDGLVGRSHECDYPETVRKLRVCTRPKFKIEGTSDEIHRRVENIVKNALSIYEVDTNALQELQPTHIVTQSQCDVCAVSLKDVEQAVCELTSSRPAIVSLQPDSLDLVWSDIRKVGSSLDASRQADELLRNCDARMKTIADRAKALRTRPTVACIEWIEPLMAAGNWMPDLVTMAGGINLFGEAGKHSPWMRWEDLIDRDPEVLFVSPCGFSIEPTLREMALLRSKPQWNGLKAVRAGRVFVADGNAYFNRPGPRIVESLEILAEMLHPDEFHFGHEGRGWVRPDL